MRENLTLIFCVLAAFAILFGRGQHAPTLSQAYDAFEQALGRGDMRRAAHFGELALAAAPKSSLLDSAGIARLTLQVGDVELKPATRSARMNSSNSPSRAWATASMKPSWPTPASASTRSTISLWKGAPCAERRRTSSRRRRKRAREAGDDDAPQIRRHPARGGWRTFRPGIPARRPRRTLPATPHRQDHGLLARRDRRRHGHLRRRAERGRPQPVGRRARRLGAGADR